MKLSDDILSIKGIGNDKANKLHKLGIYTVSDLIEYFPRRYDDRSSIKPIADISIGEIVTIKCCVVSRVEISKLKNITITKIRVKDEHDFIEIIWFNKIYLKSVFKFNDEYMFTGKIVEKFGRIQMENPDYELIDSKELLSSGRIIPIYSPTNSFTQKFFRVLINGVLKNFDGDIVEFMPKSVIGDMCTREFAINNIHFPLDNDAFFRARYRLVFDELFLLQMKLLQLRGISEQNKTKIDIKNPELSPIIQKLPFELTNAQKKVVAEIENDICENKVVNRLIQGDVGSGKTAVAQIISYMLANNGYQVAVMSPTEVLASQHFESFSKLFKELGIECIFLAGSQTAKQKREIYESIESGKANIIIGTHALIQDKVKFKNLGLVITDEQHRFGVKQRENLTKKGDNPHTIVMTATPIPRTLALILYGDLDISIIDELPPNRKVINTSYVNTSYYPRVYNFLKKNADEKRQTYIICPMIEESDKSELKSVIEYTQKLKNEIFSDYTIECLHGKMKNSEKIDIMQRFSDGYIDILVSTTVIEVGINVPNSTIMVIENAERFGISQLHQLRGRVGRGADKSYCVLISDTKNKQTIKRLKTMVEYSDGFVLSEKDLELRGSGDFFGTRQHGVPEMRIANLYEDMEILKDVQKVSLELYKQDPLLKKEDNQLLKLRLEQFFNQLGTLSL